MTTRKILVLASYAPSLQNFRGALIKTLCQKGVKVHAAAPSLKENNDVSAWLEELGVVCHNAPLSRVGLNPLDDLASLWKLISLMRRIRPDIFLGYTIKPVIWGLIAARFAGVPQRVALVTGLGYAFTGDSGGLRGVVRRIARKLYQAALKYGTLVFFQNSDDRDEFTALGLLRPEIAVQVVAGSGVDTKRFSFETLPPGRTRFLLIARLLGDKGIREYVDAARTLRRIGANSEYHLVGGLDQSPDGISQKEVTQWHDDGDIIWHGYLPDVRAAIAGSHVFVLPSYREGTPRTVLEAMSIGRPIITTDAPGCRETVVPDLNGLLVPVKDSDALACAMLKFVNDRELATRMGIQSRRIAEEKYDVHKVNAEMIYAMDL